MVPPAAPPVGCPQYGAVTAVIGAPGGSGARRGTTCARSIRTSGVRVAIHSKSPAVTARERVDISLRARISANFWVSASRPPRAATKFTASATPGAAASSLAICPTATSPASPPPCLYFSATTRPPAGTSGTIIPRSPSPACTRPASASRAILRSNGPAGSRLSTTSAPRTPRSSC